MTYYELTQYIEDKVIIYYPTGTTIQFTEGDINQVNFNSNKYPAFHLFLDNMIQTSNSITYNLVLFYIDILLQDRSNKITIQSDGLEILKSIIASIDVDLDVTKISTLVSPFRYTTFTEKYTDECAGAFVQFALMYNNDTHCD